MVAEISILIPVYNFDINFLVRNLLVQCDEAGIRYEIICLDDASEEKFKVSNRSVANLANVIYEELPYNISRAAIRNKLGYLAHYSFLLFIDNDSEVISQDYILHYLRHAHPQQVLIGGTAYSELPPTREFRLHWQVGRSRDQKSAEIRNRQPYRNMHVNNALVPHALFLKYNFEETITRYGHEDSQWAKRLERANVTVIHLDNPVGHVGLEPTNVFLQKTRQAIDNLQQLFLNQQVVAGTSLVNTYLWLVRYRLINPFYTLLKFIRPGLLFNLRSKLPHLICFDLYKLGLFIETIRKEK